jgi:hypothetical protein
MITQKADPISMEITQSIAQFNSFFVSEVKEAGGVAYPAFLLF